MNFATLKGLTIPEGNVTKITDASGRVLWSAVKMATVKLKATGDSNGYAWTIIDGVRYEGTEEVTVPSGTVITCYAKLSPSIVPKFNNPCYISVNGTRVADTQYEETISHTFTVNADATISMYTGTDYDDRDTKYQYGSIAIVAVPEGYAFVQVAGNGNGNIYVTID